MSGPLQKYRYVGRSGETVLKLSEADATRLGLGPDDVVGAAEETGVQTLSLPADGSAPSAESKQRSAAQNKARQTAANKGGRASRKAPPAPDDEQSQSGDEQQAAPHGGGDGGPGGGD
ncbi:hypothetical protein AB0L80_07420 [Streptomyces sp. NPDC052069]|uniref:hypothetical protein n=1 Tax=Streptomyces sp. NPDC052069 TaxID=3154650 RepID=UPI00343F67F9